MQSNKSQRFGLRIVGLCVCVIAAMTAMAGCQQAPTDTMSAQVAGQPGQGQQLFASDDDAAKGLLEALKTKNKDAMLKVLGSAYGDLLSGDPVEDARRFDNFAEHAQEQLRVEKQSDTSSILRIGKKDWPFPIPLTKTADGKWFFDTAAGKDEILARRIGGDELATIKVCRAYVQAQREYASKDRDGSEVLKYAQHFRSSPGKHDGLYWEAAPGEEESPYGSLAADAALKGYTLDKKGASRHPFQGYFFHILTKQGSAAPGGRYDYVINGNMIAGFAMVACPSDYGSSGVMTFIVSHQGKVYQKDLGPKTLDIVSKMTEYNPDSSWTLVKD